MSQLETVKYIAALEHNFEMWKSNLNFWSIFTPNDFTVLVD